MVYLEISIEMIALILSDVFQVSRLGQTNYMGQAWGFFRVVWGNFVRARF